MKLINNAIVSVNHREFNYDIYDFDHIKDVLRSLGFVGIDITILCGDSQYKVIENMALDYIKAYCALHPKYSADCTKRQVFSKNGVTYHIYPSGLPNPWSYIILLDFVELDKLIL